MLGMALIAAVFVAPQLANAGLATDLLVKDGVTENTLNDYDWERLYNPANPTDTKIDVGDTVYGFWEVEPKNVSPGGKPSGDTFVAAFAIKCIAKVSTTYTKDGEDVTDYRYGFAPVGADTFRDIFGLTVNDNTAVVVFSDQDGFAAPPTTASSPSVADITGPRLFEFGFGTTPVYDTTGFKNIYSKASTPYWVTTSLETDDMMVADGSSDVKWAAALDLTANYTGLGVVSYEKVVDKGLPAVSAQLFLSGASVAGEHGLANPAAPWLITNSDIFVKVTPEPGQLVGLLGVAITTIGLWMIRRRRK
jgi:hypothetical protein